MHVAALIQGESSPHKRKSFKQAQAEDSSHKTSQKHQSHKRITLPIEVCNLEGDQSNNNKRFKAIQALGENSFERVNEQSVDYLNENSFSQAAAGAKKKNKRSKEEVEKEWDQIAVTGVSAPKVIDQERGEKTIPRQQAVVFEPEPVIGKQYGRRSLFIFSRKNRLRMWLLKLVEWKGFEIFILGLIFVNSLVLALYDYEDRQSETKKNQILDYISDVLTYVFMLECVLKIIAYGFVLHKKAYLRSWWNIIDFAVVLSGQSKYILNVCRVLELLPFQSVNLKYLRVLRVLRPLRSINIIPSLKMQVESLISALPDFVNVGVFMIFIFLLLSNLGLYQFNGMLYNRCRLHPEPELEFSWQIDRTQRRVCSENGLGLYQCNEGTYCGNPSEFHYNLSSDSTHDNSQINYGVSNFDNIGSALLTVFQVVTLDGWTVLMYDLMDADFPLISCVFFCLVIVLCSFITINLILAVIIQSFINFQKDQLHSQLEETYETHFRKEVEVPFVKKGSSSQSYQTQRSGASQMPARKTSTASARGGGLSQLNSFRKQMSHASSSNQQSSDQKFSVLKKVMLQQRVLNAFKAPPKKEPQADSNAYSDVFGEQKSTAVAPQFKNFGLKKLPYRASAYQEEARQNVQTTEAEQAIVEEAKGEELKTHENHEFRTEEALKRADQEEEEGPTLPLKNINPLNAAMQEMFQKLVKKTVMESRQEELKMLIQEKRLSITNIKQMQQGNNLKSIDSVFAKKDEEHYQLQKQTINDVQNLKQLNSLRKNMTRIQQSDSEKEHRKTQKAKTKKMLEERADRHLIVHYLYILQGSIFFQAFIALVIISNTVILSLDRYPIDPHQSSLLNTINLVFTVLFALEMCIKLVALGLKGYFSHKFNVFDAFIVLLSLVDLGLSYSLATTRGNALTALRAFRLLRVFKLAKHWDQFQMVLKIVEKSLKQVAAFAILLFLFMYIYTLMGLELFAHKARFDSNKVLDLAGGSQPQINFDSFINSFVAVFVVLANDAWSITFFDYFRAAGPLSSTLFFLSLIVIGQKILLNLFLAIVLNNFDQIYEEYSSKEIEQKIESFSTQVIQTQQQQESKEKRRSTIDAAFSSIKVFFASRNQSTAAATPRISSNAVSMSMSARKSASTVIYEHDQKVFIEGRSLFLLNFDNRLRILLFKLQRCSKFEVFISLTIFMSCLALSLDNPFVDPDSTLYAALYYLDLVSTVIFSLECVVKVMALGFVANGRNSYLRSPWNVLDFVIVVVSVIGFFLTGRSGLKLLKLLRVLRPLRVINKNEGLKTAVLALVMAIPNIVSIILIVVLFFIIFGIIAISYFKGTFYYCSSGATMAATPMHKWDCLNSGGLWKNSQYHFDDIFNAISTLFQMSTTQNWPNVMVKTVSATSIDHAQLFYSKPYWALFSIAFVIVGGFFLLNLFVGVVILRFQKQKDDITGFSLLTPEQQQWVDIKIMYMSTKPLKKLREPESKLRKWAYNIHSWKHFENVIFGCIIANSVILPIKWYGEPDMVGQVTGFFNILFTMIFTFEALIKLLSLGLKYFKDGWNIFDFLIVAGSLLSLVLTYTMDVQLGGAISILRAFRVGRLFRLVNQAKKLKIVFNTFIVTFPALANVGGLLFLLIYLYAILGVELFGQIKITGYLTENLNFQSFSKAFLLLFVVTTGDSWTDILRSTQVEWSLDYQCLESPSYADYLANDRQTVGCGMSNRGYAYFYSYFLLVSLIFLNLFIAIVLDGFQETQKKEQRNINAEVLDYFKKVWAEFDPDVTFIGFITQQGTGYLKIYQLKHFLKKLGPPLGFGDDLDESCDEDAQRFISELELPIYNAFSDYFFLDVIEKLIHKSLIDQLTHEKLQEENQKAKEFGSMEMDPEFQVEEARRLQDEVKQTLNRVQFSEGMNNIQALKEMNKMERRTTMQKQALNRDNHFTSSHQVAAFLAVKKFKNRLHAKKLEDQRRDSGQEASEGSSISNNHTPNNLTPNNAYAEGSASQKQSQSLRAATHKLESFSSLKGLEPPAAKQYTKFTQRSYLQQQQRQSQEEIKESSSSSSSSDISNIDKVIEQEYEISERNIRAKKEAAQASPRQESPYTINDLTLGQKFVKQIDIHSNIKKKLQVPKVSVDAELENEINSGINTPQIQKSYEFELGCGQRNFSNTGICLPKKDSSYPSIDSYLDQSKESKPKQSEKSNKEKTELSISNEEWQSEEFGYQKRLDEKRFEQSN